MEDHRIKISAGYGKFTGPGVGAMTLLFPKQMPHKAKSLSIIDAVGAIRELGVAAHTLLSLTLVSAGTYSAYVAFTASGGIPGNAVALACGIDSILADCSPAPTKEGWWKGNTHTHSNQSDGDSSPEVALNWYDLNGYDFVTLTDHDKITPAQSNNILTISGSEITAQNYPALHMAVSNITTPIAKGAGNETQAINSVIAATPANAIAVLAHPGWQGASVASIAAASGLRFIEIFNGVPSIGSSETIWDNVLYARITGGNKQPLYGVAVDDTHTFASNPAPGSAVPGNGWVMVRASAPEPTVDAVIAAMQAGDFYTSTGVILNSLERSATTISMEVDPDPWLTYGIYTVVGTATTITSWKIGDNFGSYTLQPDDVYARLVAVASDGMRACSQPIIAP